MPDEKVAGSTFVIASSGFADGPAQALRQHLLDRDAALVVEISHPLVAEGPTSHRVVEHRGDGTIARNVDPRLRPPLSYALDPTIPLRLPRSSGWFGFNCLATGRGLAERGMGRTKRVVHWNVDFVPQRFGTGPFTGIYEAIDGYCCRHANARVDLSREALEARAAAYKLSPDKSAPGFVVPMGAWLDRSPKVDDTAAAAGRIVFLGHLVPRMGVDRLLDAVELLHRRGQQVTLDVIGGGPELEKVQARARLMHDRVTVHGFVEDIRDVEAILAQATVAAAPYAEDSDSFTRWADPGKLKMYLGAGLPIVMTGTPPIASQLEAAGAALVVSGGMEELAEGLHEVINDHDRWQLMRAASLAEGARYDWPVVLDRALADFGFVV